MSHFQPVVTDDPLRLRRHYQYFTSQVEENKLTLLGQAMSAPSGTPEKPQSIPWPPELRRLQNYADGLLCKLSRLECWAIFDAMQTCLPPELRDTVYEFLLQSQTMTFPTNIYNRTFPSFTSSRSDSETCSQPFRAFLSEQFPGTLILAELVSYWYKHNKFVFQSPYTELVELLRVRPFEGVSTIDLARNLCCVVEIMELPHKLTNRSSDKEAHLSFLMPILDCPPGTKVLITTRTRSPEWLSDKYYPQVSLERATLGRLIPVLWSFITKALNKNMVVVIEASNASFTPQIRNATPEYWIAELEILFTSGAVDGRNTPRPNRIPMYNM